MLHQAVLPQRKCRICEPFRAGLIARIPQIMTYEEAAALCDGPLTDMNFLRNLAALKPGQHILINGRQVRSGLPRCNWLKALARRSQAFAATQKWISCVASVRIT